MNDISVVVYTNWVTEDDVEEKHSENTVNMKWDLKRKSKQTYVLVFDRRSCCSSLQLKEFYLSLFDLII